MMFYHSNITPNAKKKNEEKKKKLCHPLLRPLVVLSHSDDQN
jgi:hypothetical protein